MHAAAAQQTPNFPEKPTRKQAANNNGWTPARRAKQSAAIQKWSPWAKSTGPKTREGKARVAQNAAKPHLAHDPVRTLENALADHGRYLTDLNRFLNMKKHFGKNKLMDRRIQYREKVLLKRGQKVSARLYFAALYADIRPILALREINPDYAKILLFGRD